MKPGTLWGAGAPLDPEVFAYTVAADRPWDARLLPWDILGSLGHLEGLRAAGLLSASEQRRLSAGLRTALAAARAGDLEPGAVDEDVHTTVERWLTARDPEAGPRLHAGRSRNEQVACDVRLYLKHELLAIHAAAATLAKALLAFAARHRSALWPGYTHLRRAMPSSAGLWSAAFAEGVIDTLEALPALWTQVDRSPLGTGAGYGVPIPIPRERVARALGFGDVVTTAAAVQNGRGKLEAAVLAWCAQLGHDTGRLAADAILYGCEEFGFLVLPGRLATGSSLMPQKRNPDVLELTRARAAALDGDLATVHHLKGNLTGGYHRDFQLLKEPLMRGLDRTLAMTSMLAELVPALVVDRRRARAALSDGILATDEVMRRVEEGAPFRPVYRSVAAEVAEGARFPTPPVAKLLERRRSTGGLGALGLDRLRTRLRECGRWAAAERRRFETAVRRLAGP